MKETRDGNFPEVDAMWHNLALIAMKEQNLMLAERCHADLGNVATAHYLQETSILGLKYLEKNDDSSTNSPEVWARLAILGGDLNTAENIYLEQGDLESALQMYKNLHKWNEAIRLAEQRTYSNLKELKEEHTKLLLESNQFDKMGQVLEKEGQYEQALNMYIRSNKLQKVPNLLIAHQDLLNDHTLVANVLKHLIKNEMFEAAAEIYEKLDKSDLALECYRKGKVWDKAVELAREVNPDQVVTLEEEWGDYLVENKQLDAAISHFIEGGCTLKALNVGKKNHQDNKYDRFKKL